MCKCLLVFVVFCFNLTQQAFAAPTSGNPIPYAVFAEILKTDDVGKLEELIAQGYDCNKPLKKGDETAPEDKDLKAWPITEAARANSYPLVKCLLAHDVDANAENDAHVAVSLRPITYAAHYYNVTMFKLLVENGVQLSWPDQYADGLFDGCLCDIIYNKDSELLKFALEHGAHPNASNCGGDICMHPMAMAADQNNLQTLKLLVRYGGDVNYQDPYGTSTLLVAIKNGNLEIVQFILANGGDPNKYGNNGKGIDTKTPLAYAKELGNNAIIAELLKYDAKEERVDTKP